MAITFGQALDESPAPAAPAPSPPPRATSRPALTFGPALEEGKRPAAKGGTTRSDLIIEDRPREEPTSIPARIVRGVGRGIVQMGTTPAKLAGTALDVLNRGESAVLNPIERALGMTPKPGVTGGVALKTPAEWAERTYGEALPVTPASGWKERAVDIGSELAGGFALGGSLAGVGRRAPKLTEPAPMSPAGTLAKEATAAARPVPPVQFRPDLLTGKPTVRMTTTPEGRTVLRPATTKVQPPTPAEVSAALSPPRIPGAPPDAAGTATGQGTDRFAALHDEQGVIKLPETVDAMRGWAKAWKKMKAALPQEEFVRRIRPGSPVITEIERYNAVLGDAMSRDVAKAPWFKELKQLTPAQLNQYEADAVRAFEAGGRTPAALRAATASWPKPLQQYVQIRNGRLGVEQAAREYLGLDAVPEIAGPYLPRITDAEARGVTQISGHVGAGGLQTTLKDAMHHRVFPTQLEGEAAGYSYIDRRNAIVLREWNSLKLERTAQLVKNLEQRGGLFRTRDAAQAASPMRQAFPIEGIPGNKTWWTPTQEEATFLAQNLAEYPHGGVASLKHYADALFRNPNLFNPAPHAIKNMGAKYLLARGPVGAPKLAGDVVEYVRGSNPSLLAEFKQFMPFSETEPGYLVLEKALIREKGPKAAVQWTLDQLGKVNKLSSEVIFKVTDPAMRYSLFKHYRAQGLPAQDAANQAWIDLVRYGTRSTVTDFWKSIPMDFFVPWRVGTVTTLIKQASLHPMRTALTIGGIDYLRELRYRETGRWTHLPWDYVEGPLALALQDPKSLPSQAILTALFGPVGEQTAAGIERILRDLRGGGGKGIMADAGKVFWGVSQFADPYNEWAAYQRDGEVSHLVNMLMGALLGERQTKGFQPHRLQGVLPESLPSLEKSRKVRGQELVHPRRSSLNPSSNLAQAALESAGARG